MSDLLKESIADAKAVRETAIANAKTFLEENFAKSMKEMFAEKLKEESEEAGEEKKEEGKIEEKLSSSGIGKDDGNFVSDQKPVQPSTSAKKNTTPAGKQEFDATLEEGEEITSEELDEILAELEQEGKKEDGEKEEKHEVVAEEEEASEEEVVDLDELLAELEVDEQAPVAPVAPAPAVVDPAVAAATPAVPAAPVAAAPGQVPSPMEEDTYEEEVTAEEMAEALVAINEENEALKNSLKEHQDTVKYLKGVLEETNLLNAKLLYTNKIFKGKNLTEDQKLKVINTFDLTKTLREIKLAYTVLAESFNAGGSVVKKKTNATVSTITEGLASKPVSSTKPDSTIVEPQADVMASRFQKLAGIKK
jgi:hypothetical protein